ncbi:MAG: hypothetical protein WDN26_05445 [Chitinophagaceae bacterium]
MKKIIVSSVFLLMLIVIAGYKKKNEAKEKLIISEPATAIPDSQVVAIETISQSAVIFTGSNAGN